MKSSFPFAFTAAILLIMPNANFGQAPDLGAASGFALFTSVGAFQNAGATSLTGDIGTHSGSLTGFPPGTTTGQIHVADAVSAQAAADLAVAFGQLNGLACGTSIGSALGNGQILAPGVYCTGAASTLNGELILDANDNPNSIFIIKTDGLLTAISSKVSLINSAASCNVFWLVNGAFTAGRNSVFIGTVVANGAITLNAGAILFGRGLTTAGAISINDNAVSLSLCGPPSVFCGAGLAVSCVGEVPLPNVNSVEVTVCSGPFTVVFMGDVISNQTCANRFDITRTYRAMNACGNTATCSQAITVFDHTPPAIAFVNPLLVNGGTIEVQCFGQDTSWTLPNYDAGSIVATDNCAAGPVSVAFSKTLESLGSCATDGFIVKYRLNWTATDACGNINSAFVILALIDTIPPVLYGVPVDVSVDCFDIPGTPADVFGIDECPCVTTLLFVETPPTAGCQNGQVILRKWTAIDQCGNATTETQIITLLDKQGPEMELIEPQIAGLPDGSVLNFTCNEGGIPPLFGLLNSTSVTSPVSCGGSASIHFQTDLMVANYCKTAGFIEQQTFKWTALDECGNETELTIYARLIDTEVPTLSGVPTMACINDPLLNNVEVADNCGQPTLEFHDLKIPNPCGNGTAIRRIYEAWDDCGNVARDTAILLPNDGSKPIIEFVNPVLAAMISGEILTVDCAAHDGQFTAFGVNDVNATDGCPAGLTVGFAEKLIGTGDCATNGIVAILELKWTATDLCGNSASLAVAAHVVDETSPVFDGFIPEITIGCNGKMPTNFATDNCGDVLIATIDSIIPGDCVFEYEIKRLVTATDPCGNSLTKLQIIHVGDGSGPVISGVEAVLCDDLSIPVVTAWDPCAERFVPVSMSQDTVDLPCLEGLVIERIWTAVDSCGNVSERRQIITLNDHTPPVILIPDYSVILQFPDKNYNQILLSQTDLLHQLAALNAGSVLVADDCDQTIIPVFTVDTSHAADCKLDGYFERRKYTWTATDACGNAAFLSFTVDIRDDVPPVILSVPFNDSIVCVQLPPVPVIQAEDATPTAIVYSETIAPGSAPGVFIVSRKWTATDACGNTSVYVQPILWIPDTFLECDITPPPLVECNSHGVEISSVVTGGLGPVTYLWVVNENCCIQGGQGTPQITIYVGWTETKITLTVTDAFGCSSVCSTTISCVPSLVNPVNSLLSNAQTGQPTASPTAANYLQQLHLWPNPAAESIHLSFESPMEQAVEISLLNLLGQPMLVEKMTAQKGFNAHRIAVQQLPKGGYRIQLKTDSETWVKGVVIMRNE